ncbi:serine hydrolase domain-containing protein [Actinoplanes sp. NPDC024001]|uniref:serine hydrolase domain-containing protein n=1 Tax=Actinoplanes sp. NPDC024001 TaxID=3154598 RepID=UPI0033DB767F
MLILAEQGVLSLDDHIDRWIGGCPWQWSGITLHHLLTHTSGLGHWDDYPMIDLTRRVGPDDLVKTFHGVPVKYPPGAGWSYSSPGYVLLAHVVERASNTPYRQFLAARIFAPLGSDGTFAGMPGAVADVARGHDATGRPLATWELDVVGMGAGDVWSTARDMVAWLDVIQNGRLLREPYRTLMITAQAETGKGHDAGGYGYGVFVGVLNGRRCWYHNGHNAGFKAFAASIPETDRRIVVLSNSEALDSRTCERFFE